jgi:phosphate starvation-inducible PhoH-like protein
MRKKQKLFDVDSRTFVTPRNKQQQRLVDSILFNPITVVIGPAGTGKSLLSIQTLYNLMKSGQIDQIFIIRLITETFGENIGSLPGQLSEKLNPFMGPIEDNLHEFLPPGEVEYLLRNNKIEVLPVSFCRGRSFINKGVIIEESQNLTPEMILTISTRIGRNSKLVFNGDSKQTDFYDRNGALYLKELYSDLEDTDVIEMHSHDIQRHSMISKILDKAASLKATKLANSNLHLAS